MLPPVKMPPVTPTPSNPTRVTNRMEAAFLEQMLKYMGPQALRGEGSGGTGEAQFQSFLTQEYARLLADRIDLRLDLGAAQ